MITNLSRDSQSSLRQSENGDADAAVVRPGDSSRTTAWWSTAHAHSGTSQEGLERTLNLSNIDYWCRVISVGTERITIIKLLTDWELYNLLIYHITDHLLMKRITG